MAHHVESPFVAESVPGFNGLRYFPIDPKFRVRATLDRLERPTEAFLRTNRDGQLAMRCIGELSFSLDSRALKLKVYHAGEGVGASVFVPFRDSTSGSSTYGPGRYLTFELNPEDIYELDFNRAFNPYCAYTEAYECGFPPAENDLSVAVRAGERVWASDRNPRSPSGAVLDMIQTKLGTRPGSSRPKAVTSRKRKISRKPKGRAQAPTH